MKRGTGTRPVVEVTGSYSRGVVRSVLTAAGEECCAEDCDECDDGTEARRLLVSFLFRGFTIFGCTVFGCTVFGFTVVHLLVFSLFAVLFRGILAEGARTLFVAGQIGVGDRGNPGSLPTQLARALASVRQVVLEAGGTIENIGRLTIYVTDMEAYLDAANELNTAYRSEMGPHYPAMTLIEVSGLVHPEALVEIEATAVLP